MKNKFPKLPGYEFTWRSLQIEPVPFSGERITLAVLIKGWDKSLIIAKLVNNDKLRRFFGPEFTKRIIDSLSLCMYSAESFYKDKDLTANWNPPLEGFHLGKSGSSIAENIEDAIFRAAMYCSSYSVSLEAEKSIKKRKNEVSAPESWRKNVLQTVTSQRADYANYFEISVPVRGTGVPITYNFLSKNYAAQFDAVREPNRIQQGLVRAQSKLWQLDRLRDEGTLFQPEVCELLLNIPGVTEENPDTPLFEDFVEELRYEASKRELSVFASGSVQAAARHVINNAA